MYENPEFNEKGEKILCEENGEGGQGKNSQMLMDVRVQKLSAGQRLAILAPEKETAVMLLAGKVVFGFEGKEKSAERRSVFLDKSYVLHCCRGKEITITAGEDSRVLIQQTTNEREFDTVFYTPEMCTLQEFGKTQWEGTAHRQVLTVFDYENAPYSNLVMGEVFHKPGCWSSYPPHYHPQPELYYYEFDKPQGFGVGFVGEECFRVEDQGCLAITPMHAHQQAAAPGYRMYYVWLIRHLEGDPWRKTRIVEPAHDWLDHSDY
ncbi:MAG: 5-deoxy-glucuronate isomerase [Roseburia sp.]|nr:5-deoxy-glucuronate isomerase [Roseburia sp.]MCM1097220.1 5-deoxy-glucuronate isomerase [Ruminococcus flavefaciens]